MEKKEKSKQIEPDLETTIKLVSRNISGYKLAKVSLWVVYIWLS